MMKSKYLRFEDVTPDDRKTKIHEISNSVTSDDLGRVLWYGGWRKYVWEIGSWRFDSRCLRDLADHIDTLIEARKRVLHNSKNERAV